MNEPPTVTCPSRAFFSSGLLQQRREISRQGEGFRSRQDSISVGAATEENLRGAKGCRARFADVARRHDACAFAGPTGEAAADAHVSAKQSETPDGRRPGACANLHLQASPTAFILAGSNFRHVVEWRHVVENERRQDGIANGNARHAPNRVDGAGERVGDESGRRWGSREKGQQNRSAQDFLRGGEDSGSRTISSTTRDTGTLESK